MHTASIAYVSTPAAGWQGGLQRWSGLPCMMKEVGGGEAARSGFGSSEKGVASDTAGGVPGEDGLGTL